MQVSRASFEVYPGLKNEAHRSDLYRVEVKENGRWDDSYTYQEARKSVTDFFKGKKPSTSFTTFGTNAPVKVKIKNLRGPVQTIAISPRSKGFTAQVFLDEAEIELKPLDKIWVVINGDEANPLFIFADPLKPAIPANAIVFGPGVHEIGIGYKVKSGQTIYLEGGAWLSGTLDVRDQHDVAIIGPGIISTSKWPSESVWKEKSKSPYFLIWTGDNQKMNYNIRVDGPTLLNSPGYNMVGVFNEIRNVKLISPWYWSTDGFQVKPGGAGRLGLIEHCFAFTGDDVFFPRQNHLGNIEVRDCLVGSTNNSIFNINYWGYTLDHNYTAYLHDIDIVSFLKSNSAVFRASYCAQKEGQGVKNMTFENIAIERELTCPLFQLENREYFWPDQFKGLESKKGNGSNFVFRNVSATFPVAELAGSREKNKYPKSTLLGLDAQNGQHNYTFDRVSINGTILDSSNYSKYLRTNEFVTDLKFVATDLGKTMNVPPTAVDLTVAAKSGQPVAISLQGTDADGTVLDYSCAQPAHGEIRVEGATVTYVSAAGFSGTDRFSYTARDNRTSISLPAQVTIEVAK